MVINLIYYAYCILCDSLNLMADLRHYPFSIPVEIKVSLQDMIEFQRGHYEGTRMSQPYLCI